MTTTIEHAEKLERLALHLPDAANVACKKAAQRLRELDKPDCVWHKYLFRREPDGKETFAYAAPCFPRYEASHEQTVHMTKSNYCPNCGGAVKEST